MSRYIDADALKKRVSELIVPDWTRTLIVSWVDAEPTVDAVPVVRCRECKHTKEDGCGAIYCKKWDRLEMPEDYFCADGERRT